MSLNIEYDHQYFKVIKGTNPDGSEYYFSHGNDKVVVLPYWHSGGETKIYTLLEPIKIWGSKSENVAVTGTIETGEHHFDAGVRELEEEIGFYVPDKSKWEFVGEFGVDKSTTAKRYLYLCDVFQSEITQRSTDGSFFEKLSKVVESSTSIKSISRDITLHFLIDKLEKKLENLDHY